MRHRIKNSMRIIPVGTLSFSMVAETGVTGQNPLTAKCARLANAITGLNYHRSETSDIASGQIWRFESKGKLAIFPAGTKELNSNTKATAARWNIAAEYDRCVFKITPDGKTGQTLTFRITDTTWAIVRFGSDDKHIPDFEDHSGMKTRYCGTGNDCQKLWK